ncbi:NitT/TauT family transport system permease protein [Rhodopseudomonas julia]|uniref:NitT/TauT family transport system permease protein n=1 Tax=Rhodopseudomonas julia TaxID=200617 RepID=A0ABU0C908_9BRAD|nr:ABC transporter permease [Rhodopseudomonas julia]MDQ0325552.1 NitT/TauT family transport system permease protein [Rhodopseudomonas julia]
MSSAPSSPSTAATQSRPKSGQRKSVLSRDTMIRIITAVILIGAWEIFGRYGNPLLVAVPSDVLAATYALAADGELFTATAQSMSSFAVGFTIAAVLGVMIGVAMGLNRTTEIVLDPYINALYSMPLIALVPLLMLWVGVGFLSKVVIVALFSIFPVIINTLSGVRNVEKSYLDIGKAFGAGRWMTFRRIIMPSAVPYIASGMRLAVSRGIIAMVIAEFLTSIAGLGGLIINYTNQFETAKAFVPVFLLAIIGNILTFAVKWLEERLGSWR